MPNRGENGCWEYDPAKKLCDAMMADMENVLQRFMRVSDKCDRLNSELKSLRRAVREGRTIKEEDVPPESLSTDEQTDAQ